MLVAAVQLTSKANKKKNLAVATALMLRAVRQGAELIALPEYFSFIGAKPEMFKEAERSKDGAAYRMVREFAKAHGVYILAGSIPTITEKGSDKKSTRLLNRSILFNPSGEEVVSYDKIHLFDSDLEETRAYRESETFRPGGELRVVDTPFGKVGLSVCYDLRFPELYRSMTLKGARIIFVPAAFTEYTGKDHWLALLKARAIENQVFIIAPAQFGKHAEKKSSYGKSCVIDPWGNIIALAPDCETVIVADIDFKFLAKVRKELPVLKHYRKDLFQL
ncbi:MAG: carbon-nitrogen hydrolase family protein [Deltaproteobacteria bacterium]|nr:carbon-nitrogen hydrolase family protein [Deltaproteobacteria bacterium]